MNFEIAGKTAVVTAGSLGIGRLLPYLSPKKAQMSPFADAMKAILQLLFKTFNLRLM